MFIRFARVQLHWQTTDIFRNVFTTYRCTTFLSSVLVIAHVNFQKSPEKGDRIAIREMMLMKMLQSVTPLLNML